MTNQIDHLKLPLEKLNDQKKKIFEAHLTQIKKMSDKTRKSAEKLFKNQQVEQNLIFRLPIYKNQLLI